MQEGFGTLVAAQRGREKTYLGYIQKRKRGKGKNAETVGVIDEVLLLNKFSDITQAEKNKFHEKTELYICSEPLVFRIRWL